MAKKKAQVDVPAAVPPPVEAVGAPTEPVYAYPSRAKCPRCGSFDTVRRDDYKGTRYMLCRVPICSKKFAVKGSLL